LAQVLQHGSMFITFHAIIFESQTPLVQKCWHENRV